MKSFMLLKSVIKLEREVLIKKIWLIKIFIIFYVYIDYVMMLLKVNYVELLIFII